MQISAGINTYADKVVYAMNTTQKYARYEFEKKKSHYKVN